jgi:two-component system, NtrC family, sensor histidine kinase HydH
MARQNKSSLKTDSSSVLQLVPGDFSCGILVFDDQQNVTAINSEAARLIGWKSQNESVRHEDIPSELRELLASVLTNEKSFQDQQLRFTAADKMERLLRVQALPLSSSKGDVAGAVLFLHDFSPLDEHMRRFERLATLGTLSASMAHEIKNALVPIKTFVELLLEKNVDAELGGIVHREMERIDSIVSQMLRFGARVKGALAPTNVHQVLDHALRLIQHQIDGKQLRLVRAFNASNDLVRGDSHQLEQAFLNLFFNAIDAMRQGDELTVSTGIVAGDERPQLRIEIRDTGAGVPEETIPQLFEPFFTTKKEGTGLGLPITRRIIHDHGGTISVQSKVHEGTTFTVQIPLHAQNA